MLFIMKWDLIIFWLAILLLVDAGIGLWGLNYWQKMVPRINIKRIAFIEAAGALLLLAVYWLLRFRK